METIAGIAPSFFFSLLFFLFYLSTLKVLTCIIIESASWITRRVIFFRRFYELPSALLPFTHANFHSFFSLLFFPLSSKLSQEGDFAILLFFISYSILSHFNQHVLRFFNMPPTILFILIIFLVASNLLLFSYLLFFFFFFFYFLISRSLKGPVSINYTHGRGGKCHRNEEGLTNNLSGMTPVLCLIKLDSATFFFFFFYSLQRTRGITSDF